MSRGISQQKRDTARFMPPDLILAGHIMVKRLEVYILDCYIVHRVLERIFLFNIETTAISLPYIVGPKLARPRPELLHPLTQPISVRNLLK